MIYKLFIVAMLLMASNSASAHCFTRWRYPWPQHCESYHANHPIRSAVAYHRAPAVKLAAQPAVPDFVLPDMSATFVTPWETKEQREQLLRKRALLLINAVH